MADYSFALYDTVVLGNTAKVVHNLFQNAVNSSSTYDRFYTNMRGQGVLPQKESFVVNAIEVFPDLGFNAADRETMYLNSFIQLIYKDKLVLSIPARLAAGHNGFEGYYTQAAAADEALIGLSGMGYILPRPVLLDGGNSFRVEYGQGTAMSAASQNAKLALIGVLTIAEN